MIFLIGSIILSSYLTIAFKLCDRFGINKFQAIVFNYLACAVTGSFVTASWPSFAQSMSEPWFKWALLMGASFIVIFNLIALTVQKSGLAVASVASKLSLIIPFVFSIFLYNEQAAIIKIAGVLLALVAVVLTLFPDNTISTNSTQTASGFRIQKIVLPLIVFVSTGLLDTLIKFVEQHFITQSNNDQYLISAFSVAFMLGFLFLLVQLGLKKMVFQPKSVLVGFMIGIPNYFSIWCLMKVLKHYGDISSVIIPVNNMGIVLFSALVAWIFFKEKLSRINWVGIVLAVISIMMIAFGK
jgi:drug/metabolite transporter (DMT)-like permease